MKSLRKNQLTKNVSVYQDRIKILEDILTRLHSHMTNNKHLKNITIYTSLVVYRDICDALDVKPFDQ
jgi:hypothetical protein